MLAPFEGFQNETPDILITITITREAYHPGPKPGKNPGLKKKKNNNKGTLIFYVNKQI